MSRLEGACAVARPPCVPSSRVGQAYVSKLLFASAWGVGGLLLLQVRIKHVSATSWQPIDAVQSCTPFASADVVG